MILFRADGNSKIGTGHIMRCLSIADAFKTNGESSVFLVADASMKQLIEGRGYSVCVFNTLYEKMNDDLEKTIEAIQKYDTKALFVDSYYVTYDYLNKLKDIVKLVYIDDLASFAYPVDVLINYNIYGDSVDYKSLYSKQNTALPLLLLGTKYVPLRTEFANVLPIKIKKEVSDVLISTGGADPIHLAVELIRTIKNRKKTNGITYHFIIGAMNKDRTEIEKLSVDMDNIKLHYNVTDMKSLICSCDIAVSAAGSTLYEICVCGVPLITYVLADNQIPGATAFERNGLAINCGDFRHNEGRRNCLFEIINSLVNNHVMRNNMSRKCIKMISNCGSDKIVYDIK